MGWAVIVGSAFKEWPDFQVINERAVETPWGKPSCALLEGKLGDSPLLVLNRHGSEQRILPHNINYRANISALKALGVKRVVALNVVGSLHLGMPPGALVLPHQLIDYTWGRPSSFDDAETEMLGHIDFTYPYSDSVCRRLRQAAVNSGVPCMDGAVYGVTQGPRLETAAEITRMSRDGADLVGMTGMPEAALAREAGLEYAAICTVVNWAAGKGDHNISLDAIEAIMAQQAGDIQRCLYALVTADSDTHSISIP